MLAKSLLWCLRLLILVSFLNIEVFASDVIEIAANQIGKPYEWGAAGPDAFDCSGLTKYVYAQCGVALPHHAADQAQLGTLITSSFADLTTGLLQPGDLLFWDDPDHPGEVTHVSIYDSGNSMIHATDNLRDIRRVVRSSFETSYWSQHLVTVRRFMPSVPAPAPNPVTVIPDLFSGCTASNHLDIAWSKSNDADFASYKLYRATHPGVTTADHLVAIITNNTDLFPSFRDNNLLPGIYFYKVFVFNRAGRSSGSNELLDHVFAPNELIEIIPGVPDVGGGGGNVLGPRSVSLQTAVDCLRHRTKSRVFPELRIEHSAFNGIANLQIVVHQFDTIEIRFTAVDDGYTVIQPEYNWSFEMIGAGTQFFALQGAFRIGTFPITLRRKSGSESIAGTLVVVP